MSCSSIPTRLSNALSRVAADRPPARRPERTDGGARPAGPAASRHRLVRARALPGLLAALLLAGLGGPAAAAPPRTVCAITINSDDERESFRRHLPPEQFRVVELVQRGRADWLDAACRSGVRCDALIVSGHFDDGSEFYADQRDHQDVLTVPQLQQAACSPSCSGLFAQLREVYLFGCKTLGTDPRLGAGAELRRALQRDGLGADAAARAADQLAQRYGQSNRDRLRHIFQGVPLLYGFPGQAPLGRFAGPLLDRYFQTVPGAAAEVAGGRPSPALLGLFSHVALQATPGLSAADPHAGFRQDLCGLTNRDAAPAQRLAAQHALLQRGGAEARMWLDHFERLDAEIGPLQRVQPEVDAALRAIAADAAARDSFLAFARDADEATVQTRMLALARRFGWLDEAQAREELAGVIARRMGEGRLGKYEVDHVCSTARPDPGLLEALRERRAAPAAETAHAAVLACLGDPQAHRHTVQALLAPREADAEIAQVYLRRRSLADAGELRALADGIPQLRGSAAQLRALEALTRQRLDDPASLQVIAGLFPRAGSIELQRAIAALLLRADWRSLGQPAELARQLRRHRLQSPDGRDVIDMLIRVLQQA